MNKTAEEQIEYWHFYVTDPRMDGFSQFEMKKKIYKALWAAQKALEGTPTFVGEEEWLNENEPRAA